MRFTRLALHVAAVALATSAAATPSRSEWRFTVRLDGRAIGTHRFALDRDGDARAVTSEARFEVKLLGFTAYRYEHRNRERWAGDCLLALDASTDDDGKRTRVQAERTAGATAVQVTGAQEETAALPACVMSFAYWNPALPMQRQLLDPGTGRFIPVQVTPLAPTSIDTDRGEREATGWRIAGLPFPIDVWWAGDRWVGLDTTVQGGRRLSYRLR